MGYYHNGDRELSKQYERMGDAWWRQYFLVKRFDAIKERETELDAPYIDETKTTSAPVEKSWETERKGIKRAQDFKLNYLREVEKVGDELVYLAKKQGNYETIVELYDFVGLPPENRKRYTDVANVTGEVTDIVREVRQTFCKLFALKMMKKF